MPNIYAGYDRISERGHNGDVLVTAGLGNCMAVVAHNVSEGEAVIAHINTVGLFTRAGTWPQRAWMQKVKRELMIHAPPGSRFVVALGHPWKTAAGTPANRFAVVDAVYAAFYVNPSVIGGTVRYTIATQVMEAHDDIEHAPWVRHGWHNEGPFEFDMLALTYA